MKKAFLISIIILLFNDNGFSIIDFHYHTFIENHSKYIDLDFAKEKYNESKTTFGETPSWVSDKLKTAVDLDKKKQYNSAIKIYQEILNQFANGDIYFYYGNTLSNINDYRNAIDSYEISIELGFQKSYLSHYNLACVYSILKNIDASIKHLEIAILKGYPNIIWLKQDQDLAYIRSLSLWNNLYSSLENKYNIGNSNFLIGKKIKLEYASSSFTYLFYPNNQVTVDIYSEFRNHRKEGTYKIKNYLITINWKIEKGEKGIGDGYYCAGRSCMYDKYEPFSNIINKIEMLHWYYMTKENENNHWRIENQK